MSWIPGFEEHYNDPPITGSVPLGVVGRPYAFANRASNTGLPDNADGYVYDGMSNLKPKMRKIPITEPLPPSIIAAIREANARAKRQKAA